MSVTTDDKVSALSRLTNPASRDLLYIVDVPASLSSSNTSKSIDLKTFFGNVPSNTNIGDNFTVTGNTARVKALTANSLIVNVKVTPANSSVNDLSINQLAFDSNYLYIKISSSVTKRIALSSF